MKHSSAVGEARAAPHPASGLIVALAGHEQTETCVECEGVATMPHRTAPQGASSGMIGNAPTPHVPTAAGRASRLGGA